MSDGQNSIADDILRNGFERWQRLEGEKQAISDDLKELFAELKGQGFDSKALRASFRTVTKAGDVAVEEHNALVDLYVGSLMAPKKSETGTVHATRSRAAREVDAEDRADPVAALRADPSMHIVDASNLKKKSEPQPTKAAGQAVTASEPVVTSSVENEAAEISPPITEQQAPPQPAVSDLTSPSQAPGQVAPHPVANVEEDADGAIAAASDDLASREVDDADRQQVAASGLSGEGGVGNPDPTTKYAAPGEVVWETHPPEGVERSPISMAFGNMGQDAAVIADDLEKGRAQPIVKKGKVILDGWCRYMTARDMRNLDGSPVAYPVVQYDGSDILVDMIKLNVEGRILTEQQKRLIAANLSRQQPKRKDDIYRAFELWMEPV